MHGVQAVDKQRRIYTTYPCTVVPH